MTVTVELSSNPQIDLTSSTSPDGGMMYLDNATDNHVTEQQLPDTPAPSELFDTTDTGNFFDLRPPPPPTENQETKVEEVMRQLFSEEHLHYILNDHAQYQRFISFLNRYRPHLVPTLIRYVDMRKAMKAIEYANAVAKSIRWPSHTDYCKFSRIEAAQTDVRFVDYATREVNTLIAEALPVWITYQLVSVVTDCVTRDITGQSLPVIKELIGSLGEVFCLTDPAQKDNPIIYCSEEFYRTTQYGTNFAIQRNCRFLQGPHTDKNSRARLANAVADGEELNELLLNYRRDGTPFVNLLMVSPLYDDKGAVRYFIGAQVDVTGLVLDGLGLDSYRGMLQKQQQQIAEMSIRPSSRELTPTIYDKGNQNRAHESLMKFTELSLLLSPNESEIANKHQQSTSTHIPDNESVTSDGCSIRSMLPTNKAPRPIRRIIDAHDSEIDISNKEFQRDSSATVRSLPGVYRHYLLVRPYPSLQIIFASPSLRLPGLLRTPLFTKIGGSTSVLTSLEDAFRDGASVTARILWLPKHGYPATAKLRRRWIRCTPLLGSDERIGVWMIVVVPTDDDDDGQRRSVNDSGYHSLGGSGSILGGNGRQTKHDQLFEDFDDIAAIESLVEGRRSTGLESSATSTRLRRVTILDHDEDSISQSESNFGVNLNHERTNRIMPKRGNEELVYGQSIGTAISNPLTIEEEP